MKIHKFINSRSNSRKMKQRGMQLRIVVTYMWVMCIYLADIESGRSIRTFYIWCEILLSLLTLSLSWKLFCYLSWFDALWVFFISSWKLFLINVLKIYQGQCQQSRNKFPVSTIFKFQFLLRNSLKTKRFRSANTNRRNSQLQYKKIKWHCLEKWFPLCKNIHLLSLMNGEKIFCFVNEKSLENNRTVFGEAKFFFRNAGWIDFD